MLPAAAWEAQMYIQTLTLGSMSLVFMHFLIIKHVLCLSPSLLSVAVCDDAHLMGEVTANLSAPAESRLSPFTKHD